LVTVHLKVLAPGCREAIAEVRDAGVVIVAATPATWDQAPDPETTAVAFKLVELAQTVWSVPALTGNGALEVMETSSEREQVPRVMVQRKTLVAEVLKPVTCVFCKFGFTMVPAPA